MSKAAKDAAKARDDLDRATRLKLRVQGTGLSLKDGGTGPNCGK